MQITRLASILVPSHVFAASAAWALWKRDRISPARQVSEAVFVLGWAVALNLVYPWFAVGYRARSAVLATAAVAVLLRVVLTMRESSGIKELFSFSWFMWAEIAIGVVMVILIPASALRMPAQDAVAVGSPFSEGVWYVVQGGGMTLVNHHYPVLQQRYSLDLVRLNSAGTERSGAQLSVESYMAWGSKIVSPVSGVVVGVVDGLPDVGIGKVDAANPAGNNVTLGNADGVRLLLYHLRSGSIAVREGQRVEVGDVMAEVGNSGISSEPHLHLQAMKLGVDGVWRGIPLRIEGRILHRGQVIGSGE